MTDLGVSRDRHHHPGLCLTPRVQYREAGSTLSCCVPRSSTTPTAVPCAVGSRASPLRPRRPQNYLRIACCRGTSDASAE